METAAHMSLKDLELIDVKIPSDQFKRLLSDKWSNSLEGLKIQNVFDKNSKVLENDNILEV